MVHRTNVAYLDLTKSMDENRRVMNEHLYSRLPLCDGSLDRVVGVVPTKEFLSAYHAEGDTSILQLIAHPPAFVPEQVAADRLLTTFREHKTQMLFVVDEYGGIEGIVTLTDVVDELIR
jgi:putative hemolysin